MVERESDAMTGMEGADEALGAKPQGILETVVYCECLSEARVFYEQVVGLSVVSVEPGRHVFFRVGQGMFLVFDPRDTERGTVLIGDQMIPRHGSAGPSHFAFEILPRQIDSVRERLKNQRIAIEAEIEWPTGGHSIYCRDPAGNSVEFATRELWFDNELMV
ncbi:MAG: VOC family protein [Rubripirellula sp.]|nr:VOC family protein [Rubripirellula sp.]